MAWPGFRGEMLKDKVVPFLGDGGGAWGEKTIFSDTHSIKTSGKRSAWFSVSQNKRVIFPGSAGIVPALSAWCQGTGASSRWQCPSLLRAGSEQQVVGEET